MFHICNVPSTSVLGIAIVVPWNVCSVWFLCWTRKYRFSFVLCLHTTESTLNKQCFIWTVTPTIKTHLSPKPYARFEVNERTENSMNYIACSTSLCYCIYLQWFRWWNDAQTTTGSIFWSHRERERKRKRHLRKYIWKRTSNTLFIYS